MTKIDFQENIAVLHSIIDGIPSDLINLGQFKEETECGAICCGAGWAAMHPYFQAQSLVFDEQDEFPKLRGENLGVFKTLSALFGEDAFYTMFNTLGKGRWDAELLKKGMTDKELLLARLKKGYHQHAPKHND